MKAAYRLHLISVLGLAWVSLAVGQAPSNSNDVRFVSSFVEIGEPAPIECRREARVLASSLVRYSRPDSWHWVLICDEAGWQKFLRLSGRDEGAAIYASTDLTAKTTYIRGYKLLYPHDLQANPESVIAHELAHIWLQTESEAIADDHARFLLRKSEQGSR